MSIEPFQAVGLPPSLVQATKHICTGLNTHVSSLGNHCVHATTQVKNRPFSEKFSLITYSTTTG